MLPVSPTGSYKELSGYLSHVTAVKKGHVPGMQHRMPSTAQGSSLHIARKGTQTSARFSES